MPRPTRVHVDGALCLVTCRALEGTTLFQEPRDYETYLELLREYQERYGFKLYAYVLLPSELALCLEPANGTTISTVMHALNSRYTKYVIKRHGRTGHLFQERFRLTLVEKAPWLLRLTGYLHTSPRRSGLTRDIEGYRWSSYPSYLAAAAAGVRPHGNSTGQHVGSDPGTLRGEIAEVLEALGRVRPGWTYALYLQSVPDEEWGRMGQELERPVVGSPEFLALVERKRRSPLIPKSTFQNQDDSARNLRNPVGSSVVITTSLAMAGVALVAALLSTRNVDFLRHTLKVLAEENTQTLLALSTARVSASPVQLAAFQVSQRLGGTAWNIQLKPIVVSRAEAAVSDHLRFEEEKVVSTQLSQAGFPACRYTFKTAGNGTGSWETVQIGPGGEMVSWQGQWNGRTMHGVMTRQRPGGSVETFRFVGMSAQQLDGKQTSEI